MRPDENLESAEVDITLAVPMYNEAEIAHETIRRMLQVGRTLGRSFEVLAVDDGSHDETPRILAEIKAREPEFRWVQLRPNCGQPAASQAGLLAARGRMVAIVDADLQTPPELIPEMMQVLEASGPEVAAVFGVTSTRDRDDPLRLLIGQAVFYWLETTFSRHPIPHGASSFFVIRRDAGRRIARLPFRMGNVGAVVAALGLGADTVAYTKPASYRTDSRLGLRGHVEEAIGSLALTGVLSRFGWAAAIAAGAGAAALLPRRWGLGLLALGTAGLALAGIVASERFVRRSLTPKSDFHLPIFEGEAATDAPSKENS